MTVTVALEMIRRAGSVIDDGSSSPDRLFSLDLTLFDCGRNRTKEMSLEAVEFIRRFLMHVLPAGFVKIRHYGFLSNRIRKRMVEHCRKLLPSVPQATVEQEIKEYLCPVCKIGHMRLISGVSPLLAAATSAPPSLLRMDSS
jgi:hypothetical protein